MRCAQGVTTRGAAAVVFEAELLGAGHGRLAEGSPAQRGRGVRPCELLDRITVDTLTRSGAIYTFSDTPVPGGGDVAAVFRY